MYAAPLVLAHPRILESGQSWIDFHCFFSVAMMAQRDPACTALLRDCALHSRNIGRLLDRISVDHNFGKFGGQSSYTHQVVASIQDHWAHGELAAAVHSLVSK